MNDLNVDFLSTELPKLESGFHAEGSGSMCAMELVAFIEREEHSDNPQCTCPVLSAFTRSWNDRVPDHLRNRILPLLPQLVGTRNEKYQIARAEYFAFAARDFAVKVLEGKIDAKLVNALREAKTIDAVKDAADAAANAAYAAYAANAAANAANAAAYAAYAANAAANAGNDQIWAEALEVLRGAIAVDPEHDPKQWSQADYQRGFAQMQKVSA